jgi:tetratricopeptide (TPR) repeat protein
MSLVRLGRREDARKTFDELIETGKQRLSQKEQVDVFAKFGEGQTPQARKASAHYVLGLGYLGRGKSELARSEFQKAVELNVSHVWARARLDELGRQ